MHTSSDVQLSLDLDAAPGGLVYLPDFIDAAEERALVATLAGVAWQEVVMHGQAAKRTVAHFGLTYGYESWTLDAAPPMPSWIAPLIPRIAAAMHEPENALVELLASRCQPMRPCSARRWRACRSPVRASSSCATARPIATRWRSRRAASTSSAAPRAPAGST